jgi:hypothetical protein
MRIRKLVRIFLVVISVFRCAGRKKKEERPRTLKQKSVLNDTCLDDFQLPSVAILSNDHYHYHTANTCWCSFDIFPTDVILWLWLREHRCLELWNLAPYVRSTARLAALLAFQTLSTMNIRTLCLGGPTSELERITVIL